MAAPNPEKELARLRKLLQSEQRPAVLVLQGPAQWFVQRGVRAIRDAVGQDGDITELDGAESSVSAAEAGQFLVDLRTPSLFGGQKVLLLRSGERWLRVHQKSLAETVERIAKGNMLVIALHKLDGRSALAKRIKKIGGVFDFRALYEKPFGDRGSPTGAEIVQWLVQRAKKYKLGFDPRTALFMTEVVGSDPAVLDSELARLAPTLGPGTVRADLLRGTLSVHFSSSQFELVDAILDGDSRAAFRSHRALFREGLRDKDGKPIERGAVFPLVTAWLSSSLGKLLQARVEIESGEARSIVVGRYGGYFKDRFDRQLGRTSSERLYAILRALRRAERRLRRSGEEPELLLERLLCECLLPIRVSMLTRADGAETW